MQELSILFGVVEKMIFKFALFKRHFSFNFRTYKVLDQYVAGITNRCRDGRYVVFLDFDDVPEEWVTEELNLLLDLFNLRSVHLFKTTNGYHAISTQKVNLRTLIKILRDSSTDSAYKWVPLRRARKVWTLRTTEKGGNKPKFLTTIPGSALVKGEESKPHNEILRKLYNITIPTVHEDDEEEFWTAHYHIATG